MNKMITKLLPFTAVAFVMVACAQRTDGRHVTFETEHGSWKADEVAYPDQNYKATFIPDTGYFLDEKHLTIKVDDRKIITGYTFLDNQLTIDKKMLTGDIVIKAPAEAVTYDVTFSVKNATPSYVTGKPRYHQEFTVNLKTSEAYALPEFVIVYVNGERITDGYTYSPSDAKLTISSEKVEGDIIISGESLALNPVTFKGHGGLWGSDSEIKVYVPQGSTFADAKAKATELVPPTDMKFWRWVYDGTDYTVPDDTSILPTSNLVVDARYTPNTTYSLRINDNYFPDNYYRSPIYDGQLLTEVGFDLEVDEEDIDSKYLPEDKSKIEITMYPRYVSTVELDCKYTPTEQSGSRVTKAHIELKPKDGDTIHKHVIGDISITINSSSYTTLDVTFDPGLQGQWDSKGDNEPRTVSLPNDRRFTIFEAALKANNNEMPKAKDSSFVFAGWYINDPTEQINENSYISSSVTYHAKYEAVNFENDTWENVIAASEQGLDYLYERYNTDESNILSSQRSVMIGDDTQGYVNIKARVIGVNHDKMTDGNNTALTFEFQDTFYSAQFSQRSFEGYKTAYVRTLLNDNKVGLVAKVPTFLKDHIKPVVKRTYKPEGGYDDLTDQFFLLSANELGLRQGDLPDKEESVKGDEGATYAYYANAHTSKDVLKKGSQIVNDPIYWIRSTNSNEYAWAMNEEGECEAYNNMDLHGVAPAFSIGVAKYQYSATKGTISYKNCSSQQGQSFLIGEDTAGQFNNIKVTAASNCLFSDKLYECIKATNCTWEATLSDDRSSLTCSFSYTAAQAKAGGIKIEFNATKTGKVVNFIKSNCTGTEGFPVETGTKIGTTFPATFNAAKGYSFVDNPSAIFTYDNELYDVKITSLSLDRKTLSCEFILKASLSGKTNIDISVKTAAFEVNFITLDTQHCTCDFTPMPMSSTGSGEFELIVTADADYKFDSTDNYKNSISINHPSGLITSYEIEEGTTTTILKVKVNYRVASQLGDIAITIAAFKPGTGTISAKNCTPDTTSFPYYCGRDVTITLTATAGSGCTFRDLADSQIVTVTTQTLRGDVKVTSLKMLDEDGTSIELTISINNVASRCDDIKLSINARSAAIPD